MRRFSRGSWVTIYTGDERWGFYSKNTLETYFWMKASRLEISFDLLYVNVFSLVPSFRLYALSAYIASQFFE